MKPRWPIAIIIFLVLITITFTFRTFVSDWSFLSSLVYVGTVIITTLLLLLVNGIDNIIDNKKFDNLTEEQKKAYIETKKIPFLKRLYQDAIAKQTEQEEKDIILDHGFDGIMELDNQLPKWWLGLFYFGVIFCIVYIIRVSFTDFAHPDVEYEQEYIAQNKTIEEYLATQPEITVETAKFNKDYIPEGKELFKNNCASCHKADGGGGIGPNLTDDYWMNVEQNTLFKNVFHMDYFGSKNNPSMRAFGAGGDLRGDKIQKIASYVVHINQDIPDAAGGAAPQGTKIDWEKLEKGAEKPAYTTKKVD